MGLMDKLERGLEKAVKSPFARVFKAEVQPVEIASAMRDAMDDRAAILGPGRTMTPNVFTVELAPTDHERLSSHGRALLDELVAAAEDHCDQQRYTTPGPIEVRLDTDDELETGIFRVRPTSRDGRGSRQGGQTAQTGGRGASSSGFASRGRQPGDWGASRAPSAGSRPQYDEGPEQYLSNSPVVGADAPPRIPRPSAGQDADSSRDERGGLGTQQDERADADPRQDGRAGWDEPRDAGREDGDAPASVGASRADALDADREPDRRRPTGAGSSAGYIGVDDDDDGRPARGADSEPTQTVAPAGSDAPSGRSRPPRPPKAWLEIDGRQHPLRRAVTTLGRDAGTDVVLDDAGASRRHAEIRFTYDGPRSIISVRDLGSTNGTYVNGDPVDTHQLAPGDRITVGRTHVVFHVEDR